MFIALHTSADRTAKAILAARDFNMQPREFIFRVMAPIWLHAAERDKDGDVSDLTDEILSIITFGATSEGALQILETRNWIERSGGVIHCYHWQERQPYFSERERKRKERERRNAPDVSGQNRTKPDNPVQNRTIPPKENKENKERGEQNQPHPPDEISKVASDIVTELTPLAPYRDEIETLIRKWFGEGRGKLASIVKKIKETAIEAAATATGKNTRYAPARAMEAIRALDFDKPKGGNSG